MQPGRATDGSFAELTLPTERRASAHFVSSLRWMKTHTRRSYWSERELEATELSGVSQAGHDKQVKSFAGGGEQGLDVFIFSCLLL